MCETNMKNILTGTSRQLFFHVLLQSFLCIFRAEEYLRAGNFPNEASCAL